MVSQAQDLRVSGSQGPRVILMVMGQTRQSSDRPLQIHKDWFLTIIDLEDCFFDIPLHHDDAPCFAFSVSSNNREAPLQRFHWVLLPQNSPTICQWFVAKILTLVHKVYSCASSHRPSPLLSWWDLQRCDTISANGIMVEFHPLIPKNLSWKSKGRPFLIQGIGSK